jgi:predicted nucleic acid-binding protein
MTFLDTGILVGALLTKHPEHAACRRALEDTPEGCTDAHALAETFATLTGFYKVPVEAAAAMTLSLIAVLRVEPLNRLDYEQTLQEARPRGVMGGGIYDALHATCARRLGVRQIITRNPSHFAHVAPDLEILTP